MKAVTIIGVGAEGCPGLSSQAVNAISKAHVLVGGERHLAFFPQFEGKKLLLKTKIIDQIDEISELCLENTVCVLASGDPLFYGIGNLISKRIGPEHVSVIPSPSSIQLAFARIGLKWDDAEIISLHGQPIEGLISRLQRLYKVALLTDHKNTPQKIAQYLNSYQESDWKIIVCENLGAINERVRELTLIQLCEIEDCSDLNVVILIRENKEWSPPTVLKNLDESEYAKRIPKNGLITKREIRALSLAALQLRMNSVVWDIGAGSGSVAIEAAHLAYQGKTYAIEIDPEGVEICKQNVFMHRADNVQVIHGRAPEIFVDLKNIESPDAVFIGGTKGSMADIIQLCLERLKPNGRLVVNAITLDNVAEAYETFRSKNIIPEISLVQISRGQKLSHYLRYEAMNPIHIFSVTKLASFGVVDERR